MGQERVKRAGRYHQANHRRQRREQGYRETVVWLQDRLQRQIDELIAAGKYRNRSEALTDAVERFFETQNTVRP